MYSENPEGTQVIVGSMNMGFISDTARNRTLYLIVMSCSLWCVSFRHMKWMTMAWYVPELRLQQHPQQQQQIALNKMMKTMIPAAATPIIQNLMLKRETYLFNELT